MNPSIRHQRLLLCHPEIHRRHTARWVHIILWRHHSRLGVDEIDADIQVNIAGETNLLELTVTDDSPQQSFDIMEGILENYSGITLYTVGDIVLNILEDPNIPFSPDNPLQAGDMMKKVFLIAAAALALLFGILSVMKFWNPLCDERHFEDRGGHK